MSRIRSTLTIIAAGAALCGCATDGRAGSYAWSYQQVEGEGEKLAYGAPNSDDVLLMMTCEPGSGRVLLSALAEAPQSDIVLASGAGQDRFPGEAMDSELGGMIVEAQAAARATSLRGFAETGRLSMMAGDHKVSLDAGAERADVQRFFQACRA